MILRFGLFSVQTWQVSPKRVLYWVIALVPLQTEPGEGEPSPSLNPRSSTGFRAKWECWMHGYTSLFFENSLEEKPLCSRNYCQCHAFEHLGSRWTVAASAAGSVLWHCLTADVRSCLLQVPLDLANKRILSCCAPRKLFSKTLDTPVEI